MSRKEFEEAFKNIGNCTSSDSGTASDCNIAVGCAADFEGGEPDRSKVWFDPCDTSSDSGTALDILWESYQQAGGLISNREEFEEAFKNIGSESLISGFKVEFKSSFGELGIPEKSKMGILWFVDMAEKETNNSYEEYICVETPTGDFVWEK